jgi:uncharacterized protein (TIGR04255 family)
VDRYAHPPLIEAIYELYPLDAPGWSELSYSRLASRFRDAFDGEKDVLEGVGVQFTAGQISSPTAFVQPPRHRIWTKGRGEMFQFSPQLCAYNVLSPAYTQFENHVGRAREVFSAWLEEAQPTAIAATGQRAINRIVLPVASNDPAEFFEVSPRLPLSPKHRQFAFQVLFETFEDGEVVLNLAHRGEGGDEQAGAVYYLDISARSTSTVPPIAERLAGWQTRAHRYVREAFQNALTERCKQLFRGAAT